MFLEIIPETLTINGEFMVSKVHSNRQQTKIIIAQKTLKWGTRTFNRVLDRLLPIFKKHGRTVAVAFFPQSDPLAFAKACNHPNALVLLEGQANGHAIRSFLRHQKFAH